MGFINYLFEKLIYFFIELSGISNKRRTEKAPYYYKGFR